jgi:hypothetical protein
MDKNPRSRLRYRPRLLHLAVIAAFFITQSSHAQEKLSDLTQPEMLVLTQTALGDAATFAATGDPRKRTIRSKFIENLLTGVYKNRKLNRRGFKIENAIFSGPLNLRSVTVPVEMRWIHCRFDDSVDFSSTHFFAPLFLDLSEFTNPDVTLNFNGMKVDGNFSLDHLQVAGGAQFYHLEVQGDLFARYDTFTNEKSSVEFGQAEIKGKMFFGDSTIKGTLSLADTKMLGLALRDVVIQRTLDLNHAHIQTVFDLGLPTLPEKVTLEGLTYADLTGTTVGRRLIDLIDKAEYSAQSYTQLEDYYSKHAYPELAEETFFRMKRQERKRLPWAGHIYSFLLYVLVGYGRTPQNALYISFGVVLLGTLIFWRRHRMVPRKHEDANMVYSPFWYSFDLLTPFIDLHEADVWMPGQDWWFGCNYARLHRILGWILVPIGIAAITGIIK